MLGGVIQIVDREKLLKGNPASSDPFAPTAENLLYPQVSRLDMYPTVGAHTTFPILGMEVKEFDNFKVKGGDWRTGKPAKRDFLLVVNESTQNECHEDYHMMIMVIMTAIRTTFMIMTMVAGVILGMGMPTTPAYIVMNKRSYERLPPQAKAAIDKYSGESFSRRMADVVQGLDDAAKDKIRAAPGQVFENMSAEEQARLHKQLEGISADWVKATPNGAAILAGFREEVKKVRAGQ